MPVIRGEAVVSAVTAEARKNAVDQLAAELSGRAVPNGPVVFEIPLKGSDEIDVLAIWDLWESFSSEQRSDAILQAYRKQKKRPKISQALGATYREAVEQQLLPYAVAPLARSQEADADKLQQAMISEGGIKMPNGTVALRFPTMALAEHAHRRLSQRLPEGYWSIVQTMDAVSA